MSEQTSVNKYISATGFCSRREADNLLEQCRVTVNGEIARPGTLVAPGDVVAIDDEPLKKKNVKPIYIAFYKPVGVTSTTDLKDPTNIISFIGYPKRIFPVGRLDKDSDGLIFLTNDGDIVNKILRATNNHEKEYVVSVDQAVTPEFVRQMSAGIPLDGKITKKCFVRQEGSRRFRIILTQGLNRQIRRMCAALGFKVVSLTRVRIMHIPLGNLPSGKWRYFTLPEVEKLNQLVSSSVKTDTRLPDEPGTDAADETDEPEPEKKIKITLPAKKSSSATELASKAATRPKAKPGSYKEFRKNKGKG